MNKIRIFFYFLFFFIIIQNIYSQQFFKKSYTIENGLPTRIVYDACQDKDGFMWFTTYFGISKYDGFTFTNYDTSNGLAKQNYRKLKYDDRGILWASPYFSLGNFYYKKDNIWYKFDFKCDRNAKFDITAFDVTYINNKPVICCGSNYGFYISQNKNWLHFDVSEDKSKNCINQISSHNNKFYISTKNGLCIFENGQLDWSINNKFPKYRANILATFFENPNTQFERLWILSTNWLGYIQNNEFKIFSKKFILPDHLNFNNSYLKVDGKENIFFGNIYAKYLMNQNDKVVVPLFVNNGLTSNGVTSIFIDYENNVWFTDSRGIDKISNFHIQNYFKEDGMLENEVSSIAQLNDGSIFLGHNNGISILERNKIKIIDFSSIKLNNKRVLEMVKDDYGNIWFAAGDLGVGKIKPDYSIIWYKFEKNNFAISIVKDKSGKIWIGTDKSLYYLQNNQMIKYEQSQKIKTTLRKLIPLDNGKILIGGISGLYSISGNSVTRIPSADSTKSDNIFSYLKDRNGIEFVGTMTGLYFIQNNRLVKYKKNGIMFNSPIYSIMLDKENNYWLGSNEGVYKWDGISKVDLLNKDNGLAGRETNRSAFLLDSQDGIWIGTDLGLTHIKPDNNLIKIEPPKIKLLTIESNKGNKQSLIKNSTFDFSENTLTFIFRGISFVNENLITYKYKLIGFDNDWQLISQSMIDKVRYLNLHPGKYYFCVMAKNYSGEWSEISVSGIITITTPIYKTWWFLTIIILITFSIIFAFIKIKVQRTNNIKLANEISERKRIEHDLIESKQKYQDIVKLLPETIFESDIFGKITYINDMGIKLFGYTQSEIYDDFYLNQLIVPEDIENYNLYFSMISNINHISKTQFSGLKKDKSIFPFSINSIPIFSQNEYIGSRGIIIDLTEQKLIEEKLKEYSNELYELNSSKDKFFSIVAHDLITPFSGFLGLTKLLTANITNFKLNEIHDISKNLQESAVNLFKLLENLLEWSRIQRGITKFNPELCLLSYIVKQNIDIVKDITNQKMIQITNKIPEEFQITADVPMLNTILRNLISNAIKFTQRGGNIKIGITNQKFNDDRQSTDDYVILYIKDNGIGMNTETISKLFNVDRKVSRSGTEGESSTGLGLLLCKEFVEKHGGKIWVESEESIGSTFYFTLPKLI